ncbi:hypothetical protein [Aequorivita sp. Q41]|uniref:hypothetical protein n=1 Tax=Aequorivita sp. Q41 TaxID=3153300 RepID=UPI003242F569
MDSNKAKKRPQQRTEDAEKQNEKQEREYRKEKAGTYKKPDEKDQSDQNATEKYLKIKKNIK